MLLSNKNCEMHEGCFISKEKIVQKHFHTMNPFHLWAYKSLVQRTSTFCVPTNQNSYSKNVTRCMGFDFNNMALLFGSNKAHKSEKIPMLRNKSTQFFLFEANLFSSVLTNLTRTIPTFIKRVSYRILRWKRSLISLMSIIHFLRSHFCNVINQNPSTFS